MPINKKSLENLSPIKKGERRAMKGEKPKSVRWAARIDVDLEEKAAELVKKYGSKSNALNSLIKEALKK